MSWYSDGWDWIFKNGGKVASNVLDGAGDVAKFFGGASGVAINNGLNDAAKFIENEITNKSDLRAAQLEGIASGIPGLGGILTGLNGAQIMDDLYNATGKVPKYPSLNDMGSSGIGQSIGALARKIEDGTHDLYHFYTGEMDAFRQMTNNMYG